MVNTQAEPRLLIPQLKPFYDYVAPMSWTIIRVACGFMLVMHGYGKVLRGPSAYLKGFSDFGYDSILWVYAGLGIEFIGGIALMLGLFTRFFAAAAAVEMLLIVIIYIPNGFSWLARGYEFALFWGLICFAIALRGGGPYSLDRKLGIEL